MTGYAAAVGSNVFLWIVVVLGAIVSAVLLTGHGASFIAGYNTASEAERKKYDEKKLCRVTGTGTSVITLLIAVSALFSQALPSWYPYLFSGIILAVCVAIVVLSNTICKK